MGTVKIENEKYIQEPAKTSLQQPLRMMAVADWLLYGSWAGE